MTRETDIPNTPDPLAQPRFGGLHYSERRRCLVGNDQGEVSLRPQSLAVFRVLAEQHDAVVGKDELFASVWPGLSVTDDSLVQCIADIRRVLGARAHEILRTVPRQGYMLVADVIGDPSGASSQTPVAGTEADHGIAPVGSGARALAGRSEADGSRHGMRHWAILAILLFAGASAVLWTRLMTNPPAATVTVTGQGSATGSDGGVVTGADTGTAGASANTAAATTVRPSEPPTSPAPTSPAPTSPAPISPAPAGPGPDRLAPTLAVLMAPTDDPAGQVRLAAIVAELRAALGRYGTVRLSERADPDYRLTLSMAASRDAKLRVLAEALDTASGEVFMTRAVESTDTAHADQVIGQRIAAFASPGGGALSRHLLDTGRHKTTAQMSRAECLAHGYACTTCSGETPSVTPRALECLSRLLENDPGDAAAWALKSTIHTHQYRWGHGLTEPERTDLQARLYRRDMAVQAASKAEELATGDDTAVYWALAQAYSATCERDKLRPVIERGLKVNPNDPALLAAFGNWLAFTGDWDAGAALVERALALEPEFHQPWWIYAIAKRFYEQGDYQRAYDAFMTAHSERNWLSHLMRVITLPHLGRHDEAREAALQVQKRFPGITIEKALQFEKVYCIPDPVLANMRTAMRQAGMPSRGESNNLNRIRPTTARIVKVNGLPVEVMDIGKGEPIVFVHGGVADYRTWGHFEGPISANHRFISYSLRFHGSQPIEPAMIAKIGEVTLETFALDLAALIESLGTGPVHLATWSFGGSVGGYLAAMRPDLVKSAVHFEPAMDVLAADTPSVKTAQARHQATFKPMIERLMAHDIQGAGMRFIETVYESAPGQFLNENIGLQRVTAENAHTLPLRGQLTPAFNARMSCDFLGKVRAPTLVVRGEKTNPYWQHLGQRYTECTPGAQSVTLPGVHHDGPLRMPRELADIIIDFVDRHSG
ncbi:MAG: alpha/beta fold hydrolase [Burkholderiaceae bacterium]